MQIAQAASPALRAASAELLAAEGQLKESRYPLWNNPTVSVDGTHRVQPVPGGAHQRFREWGAGVAQTFEIAGQQAFRRQVADAELDAVRANVTDIRAQLSADVAERFVKLLSVQSRIAAERENLRLVDEAAAAIGKRVAAGETSRLQGNISKVEAERARNQLAQLDESLVQARLDLSTILQLPADARPAAEGTLSGSGPYTRGLPLDVLVEASTQRRQIAMLRSREEAARSRLALERASAVPDVTVGVSVGREGLPDLRESTLGVAVSVPLPLFRKNEAAIGRAMTGLSQAQIERERVTRDVRASVLAAWDRVANLRTRASRLATQVLPLLEDNLRLSRRSFQEGEISLPELLIVNRQVVDARRETLEAQTELVVGQIALERAAGWDFAAPAPRKETQ